MHLGAIVAIVIVIAMVGLSVFDSNALENTGVAGVASPSVVSSATTATPWTPGTTTMQEPGYTNGTYIMAATNNVQYLNIYEASDVYTFYLLNEIYGSATTLLPNETISPWLATSWSEIAVNSTTWNTAAGAGLNANSNVTVNPLDGQNATVKYIYQVNIRPGVQWTDYQSGSHTYTYSNTTTFNGPNGNSHTVQYRYAPVTMNTYTVQSADFILSWKIMQSSYDYSGSYANIVNAIPVSNTTVDFYLSAQSATFLTYSLETPILPYHLWVQHDYSTAPGTWNYTASATTGGYNNWHMGYSSSTGVAPGLVGTGPFMMNGGYGMPTGQWVYDQSWKLYVNPHFWAQYVPGFTQWTPKFYELYVPQYLSLSAAVIALSLHQVYQIEGGITPTFIPTVATIPHVYIFKKPTTGYGFIQLNSFNKSKADAVTAQYGFTPASYYPPLNITSVRQALNYAVNKVYLNSVVAMGYGIPGTSVIPNSDSVWQNGSLPAFHYNPAKAMALLNATPGMNYTSSGYTYNHAPFTMNIQITAAAQNPLGVEAALLIQKWWTGIGVKTTVTQEAFSTIVSNLIGYGFKAIDLGISGIVGDPTGDYSVFYTPLGYGSGFFLGPYSSLTNNGPSSNTTTWVGPNMSGSDVTDKMVNLYNDMNTNTNLSQRIADGNYIQGLAAYESVMINLGYGIDLFPIDNGTFVNATHDTLSQNGFEYWNFLSMHLRSAATPTPPANVPEKLNVGVVTQKQVYQNGEFGNVTVQVRNQYGSAVAGANITLGVNPAGALLNLTSLSGVTNSKGQYTLEFQVLDNQPIVYTADYFGSINISAAATMSSAPAGTVIPGLGYTTIDVQPQPVAYKVVSMPSLNATSTATQPLTVEVYNPVTGAPISGYSLTLQTLAGAVNLSNGSNSQTFSSVAGSPYTEYYNTVNFGTTTSNLANSLTSTPRDVAFTPNGTFAVVSTSAGLMLVNLSDMKASGPIGSATGFDGAVSVAQVSSNASSVFAFGTTATGVTVVNLTSGNSATLATDVSSPLDVQLMMGGANDSFAFVTNQGSNLVTVFNLTPYVSAGKLTGANIGTPATVDVGSPSSALAFGAAGKYAFVSGVDNVTVLSLANLASATPSVSTTGQIMLGAGTPAGLAVVGSTLYVAGTGASANNVSAFTLVNMSHNTSLASVGYVNYSLVTNITVGTVSTLSVAGDMLLAGTGSNVTAIALTDVGGYSTTNTVVANYSTTGGANGMASMADGSLTLVANGTNNLTVLNNPGMAVYQNIAIDQVVGSTNASGEMTVNVSLKGTMTAYNVMGSNLQSYIFLGDYAAGAPVSGKAPYMVLGELTSATNPNGFGTQQPVALPVQVTQSAPGYKVLLTTEQSYVSSPSGSVQVNVTVENATGAPVPNFTVDLVSQNALGANRGYFSGAGHVIQVPNVNQYFGSLNMPGIQVVTNSMGQATAMFNAGLYTVSTANGNFIGYTPASFTDPYLVPADVFEISAVGVTHMTVAQTQVNSSQMVNNVAPTPVAASYLKGAPSVSGVITLQSGQAYTMYVNTTLNNAAGPSAGNVSFSVTASYGALSTTANTTDSNGTYALTYTAPKVTSVTEVTITVTANGQTFVEHVYVQPAAPSSPLSGVLGYALIGVFAALFVIFAAAYAAGRGKRPPAMKPPTGEQ